MAHAGQPDIAGQMADMSACHKTGQTGQQPKGLSGCPGDRDLDLVSTGVSREDFARTARDIFGPSVRLTSIERQRGLLAAWGWL